MATTLRTAQIIGFFSLPSPSLAEHNPSAYNIAMVDAPAGAGTCSQCGMGIRHHVVIRDEDGVVRYVGTDCATRIGCDPEQVRDRLTDDQRSELDARRSASHAKWQRQKLEHEEAERSRLARRREMVGDIVDMLRREQTEFHTSLANQLERGSLSPRQAYCVAKLISETGRRNKRNADAWDDVEERCMAGES